MNSRSTAKTPEKPSAQQWDIFCQVIDNFGDIGVCWRLAADLAARGQAVRLWVDDSSALAWMAPKGMAGIRVFPWHQSAAAISAELNARPSDHLVETFGGETPPGFLAVCALVAQCSQRRPSWVNLEYLSAESYVEHCHALPSPVRSGPAEGWLKHFFYPGFTPATGGLLRERDLLSRQKNFDRTAWLRSQGVTLSPAEKVVSLFCYEPAALVALLRQFSRHGLQGQAVRLLVTAGRSTQAVRQAMTQIDSHASELTLTWLPLLDQHDFDHLLWSADLNFVRGEDSLVRALWAGKPLVWQIYPQDDGAQHDKLAAFLDRLKAGPSLRALHQRWNQGLASANQPAEIQIDLPSLQQTLSSARALLLEQKDLGSALAEFAGKNR